MFVLFLFSFSFLVLFLFSSCFFVLFLFSSCFFRLLFILFFFKSCLEFPIEESGSHNNNASMSSMCQMCQFMSIYTCTACALQAEENRRAFAAGRFVHKMHGNGDDMGNVPQCGKDM